MGDTRGSTASAPVVRAAGELPPTALLAIAAALTLFSALSVRPLGLTGAGLYGLVLLVLSAAMTVLRVVDLERYGPQVRLWATLAGSVVVGLFYGFDVQSWSVSFGYMMTFAAGVRLPRHQALLTSAVLTVTAVLATLLSGAVGDGWPLWVTFTVFLPVFMGMARRSSAQQLADAQALVEQTARARTAESAASVLAERSRLARELHDVLAHSLTGVGLQLDLADAQLEAGRAGEAKATIQQARSLTVTGVAEAREAIMALRGDTLPVAATILTLVQGQEVADVDAAPANIPPAASHALVRITQESLTNARRHAPDAPAVVRLFGDDDCVQLRVSNGTSRGGTVAGSGMGLIGIRERVAALGGQSTIGPQPDGGWSVDVRLPLTRRSDSGD